MVTRIRVGITIFQPEVASNSCLASIRCLIMQLKPRWKKRFWKSFTKRQSQSESYNNNKNCLVDMNKKNRNRMITLLSISLRIANCSSFQVAVISTVLLYLTSSCLIRYVFFSASVHVIKVIKIGQTKIIYYTQIDQIIKITHTQSKLSEG